VLPSKLSRAGLLLVVSADFFLVASSCPNKHNKILKKNQCSCRRRCSSSLAVVMVSSSTSSGPVPVLRCLVLFNGTNYRDWVPRMRLHMRGLRLWDYLTDELPCPPSPSAPAQPVISKKTTAAEKKRLHADYEDRLASYESQFHAYKTWLDEDAHAGLVLTVVWRINLLLILWISSGLIRCGLFFVRSMSLLVSLPILLLFVRSSFFTRVLYS
jgi:hypothetical protein